MDSQQKYDILTKIVEISSSASQINERLTQTAHYLCVKNLAPSIAFYLLQRRGRRLILRIAADSGGSLQLPAPPYNYKLPLPDDSLCKPLTTLLPNPLDPDTLHSDDLFRSSRPHGWSLPLADENQAYGIMALFNPTPFIIDNDIILFLQVVCRQIALSLRCSLFKNRGKKKVRRLKFLHRIGAQLSISTDIQSVFSQLFDSTLPFFAQSASILNVFALDQSQARSLEQGFSNRDQRELVLQVSQTQASRAKLIPYPLVIDKQSSLPPSSAPIYQQFFKQFCAHITLPLHSQDQMVGTLEFFLADNPQSQDLLPLEKEDLELLEILAVHLAATLKRARAQDQLSEVNQVSLLRTRQLTLSHQMKNALLTADTPEKTIRLSLGALVSNEGFTCSPALYLEFKKSKNSWQALTYATAPERAPENPDKEKECNHLKILTNHLLEASAQIPKKILEEIAELKLPRLDTAPSRFQQAVTGRKPIIIPTEFVTVLHPKLKDLLPGQKIVVIPISSQEHLKGLVLASADRINLQDLTYITLFTDAAALALDNTQLYQRLQKSLASLNNAQSRLAQSEKLMALGEMATSIAHEIKNPLVSIGGFARRLHKKIPDQSREKAYSQIITKEIERLEEIVNNVLSFSRPKSNPFEPHDLNLLIEETVALFSRELKNHEISLEVQLTHKIKVVKCDGNQLKQVLINLLNNSIQAMSGTPSTDRHILVRTSCYCDLKEQTERALVEIEDNGNGIQKQFIHDIFNPFFTTKHDGTGLGLPICHRIILNHQGDIHIQNREGRGVKVSISLPFEHKAQPG
ncbi:MAG: ATP-binding protein [Pseudomonadota bacterium]|nr:ATP-binding protein [Pseudomonadota bacterium]